MLDPITVGQQIMSNSEIQEAAVKGLATVFGKSVISQLMMKKTSIEG